ncbi:hypothetical protein UCDDS831_g05768 [Diplodia seriata]|uniref:Uncharacterized protein n=1 Tax=Diplodia seriata TaxID=420778 RepID=A0A0G2G4Z2_9PEZI|nr:hypothetical protein UCDDS831_g05768 [Diplodia seriata]
MAPPSPAPQPDTDVEMKDVTQAAVAAPSQVPSVPAAKKAAGRKRARSDVDADAETSTPKRTQVQKGKSSESVANGETPARATRKPRARAGAASTPRPSRARKTAPKVSESVAADSETPAAAPSPPPAPIAGQKRGRADDDADVDVPETPKPKRHHAAAKVDTPAPAPTTSAPAPAARTPATPPTRPRSKKAPILPAWARGYLGQKEPLHTQASAAPPPTSARNSAPAAKKVFNLAEALAASQAKATATPPAEATTAPPHTPTHDTSAATKEPVDTQDSATVTKDEESAAPIPATTPAHNARAATEEPADTQDSQPAPPAEKTSAIPPVTPARNTRASRKASTPAASTTKDAAAPVPSTPARNTRSRKASTPAEASTTIPDTPARNTRAATSKAASRGTTPVEPTTAEPEAVDTKATAPTPRKRGPAAKRAPAKRAPAKRGQKKAAATEEPEEAVDTEPTAAPASKKPAPKKRAAPKKKETAAKEPEEAVDTEPTAAPTSKKPAPKKKRAAPKKKTTAAEEPVVAGPSSTEAVDSAVQSADDQPTTTSAPKKRASSKRAQPKRAQKKGTTEEPIAAGPSTELEEAVDSAVQSADAQPTVTPTPKKRASSKRAQSKRAQKDTTEEPATVGPSTELEEAVYSAVQSADAQLIPTTTRAPAPVTAGPSSTEPEAAPDSAIIQSATTQLGPVTTKAPAPVTAGPSKKKVATVAPRAKRLPSNHVALGITEEEFERRRAAFKAERRANVARFEERKAAKEAAAAAAAAAASAEPSPSPEPSPLPEPEPEPITRTPAPRKRGAAAKTSRLSTIPEVDTPKSAVGEKDVDDASPTTTAPAQRKKNAGAGASEGFLAALADFEAEKDSVDVNTDYLYAPSAPWTKKSYNANRAAASMSCSATAYLPKKQAKGKASEEASSPEKNQPATTLTTTKRARSASAVSSDSEDSVGPSSRPNKRPKKDDAQLAQATSTAAARPPSMTPTADESGLAALLQQGPKVPIGKGKARATMARKQPVKRKRTGRAASKEPAVVHHPSTEQGASSATAIDVDMVEAQDSASPEETAARPQTGGKTVARPTTGGKSVWPTTGGRMRTLSGRTVASKMVPQQSSRLGPVDDEDEDSDDESCSEVSSSDGDDDVHNRDTITIDSDSDSEASSDDDDSDSDAASEPTANEPAPLSAAEQNDASYPRGSTYPSTCLHGHRNTFFNPLQAKIPSSAVLNLHHFRASAVTQPPTAVGYVPVRLRLLVRSSVRAQRLYHEHGLAALADARYDLPAWATREAVVGYDMYLNTRGRHVWVHDDEDEEEGEAEQQEDQQQEAEQQEAENEPKAKKATSWWTAQRLLDVYAVAVYMQDVDCCDTIASAIVRTVRRDKNRGEFEMEVDTFLGQLDDVAALLDHIEDDEAKAANDDWIAVMLATGRPIRNLLLDLYSAPGHAEETLKVLKEKQDVEELGDFFEELLDLCKKRVAGTTKKAPMFMAQEMRWCEHYHLHPHFFNLDEADLLFPKNVGEEYVDRNCSALIAIHKATGCGEEEQMPETRDEKEVLAEDKDLYRRWQKWNAESLDKKDKEQFDTFEQYRARLKKRVAYLKHVEEEGKVWTDQDRSEFMKDLF